MGIHFGKYTAPDANFNYNSLLLNSDGINGAQNNAFIDSSSNNFAITRNGNVAQGTFSPFSVADGQWSNYFDKSSYFTTSLNAGNAITSTDDFTVEAWIYQIDRGGSAGTANGAIIMGDNLRLMFYTNGGDNGTNYNLVCSIGSGGSLFANNTGASLKANTWNHVAVTKSTVTSRMFVNGVQVDYSSTLGGDMQQDTSWEIGGSWAGTSWRFYGYISNARIIKGTALYTSNFTPPTAPLTAVSGTRLLTCQNNQFKENSPTNLALTFTGAPQVTAATPFAKNSFYYPSINGGSGYFDGTGDYLTTGQINLTGDFTVEAWLFPITQSGRTSWGIFGNTSSSQTTGIGIIHTDSGIIVYISDGSYYAGIIVSSTIIPKNQWSHLAITVSGSTLTIWLNGVSVGSGTITVTRVNGYTATGIGCWYPDTGYLPFCGYIANFRLINGLSIYNTTFTPPTAPLTSVANTQLLINCTNAGIYDATGKNCIETVGNAQISTSVKKYGTGSLAFDGTGDYLKAPNNDVFSFGTGDFTIEAWIYLPVTPSGSYAAICDTRFNSAANGVILGVNSSRQAVLYIGGTTYSYGSITLNTWTHIAASRSSGTNRVFINGIQAGSASNSYNSTGNMLYVGWVADQANPAFNGYIDDLRITKGIARYTTNFTPPQQHGLR